MSKSNNPLAAAIQTLAATERNSGDYTDDEGFLVCGKCHTRKQLDTELFGTTHRVAVMCECANAAYDANIAALKQMQHDARISALRSSGIADERYRKFTFERGDGNDPKALDICRRYVEHWDEMHASNTGMLFYGDIGTGKTYYACCIANALIDKGISAAVTNFPAIISATQGVFGADRQAIFDRLQRLSLLVIDDLGTERDTSYGVEQVYNAIDTRYRSGKPLIVTTNLSLQDLQGAPNLAYRRIYDRVLEMCPIRVKMVGDSRRTGKANQSRTRAREVLGL